MNAGVARWGVGRERFGCREGKVLRIGEESGKGEGESGVTVGSQLQPRQTLDKLGVGSGRWRGVQDTQVGTSEVRALGLRKDVNRVNWQYVCVSRVPMAWETKAMEEGAQGGNGIGGKGAVSETSKCSGARELTNLADPHLLSRGNE